MSIFILLRIAGALLLMLSLAHLAFPRRFQWKEELARLSLLNRQIFLVHTLFICIILAMMGVLSAFGARALLTTAPLSRWVLSGLSLFWGARLLAQWFVYDPKLWKGHHFNTAMHYLFTGLWTYLTAVYTAAWWMAMHWA